MKPVPHQLSAPPSGEAEAAPFSVELRGLVDHFAAKPVCLGGLLLATGRRGSHLALLAITLPFVTPIPLPGVSIPFGLAVALLGRGLVLGRAPWLPRWLLQRELPPRFLASLLGAASRVVRGLEYLLRPRLPFIARHPGFQKFAGLLTVLSGLMLMLPLPLPLSNSLPAWTVILFAAGALGRDGLFYLAGCAAFAVSVAFFTAVALFAGGFGEMLVRSPLAS